MARNWRLKREHALKHTLADMKIKAVTHMHSHTHTYPSTSTITYKMTPTHTLIPTYRLETATTSLVSWNSSLTCLQKFLLPFFLENLWGTCFTLCLLIRELLHLEISPCFPFPYRTRHGACADRRNSDLKLSIHNYNTINYTHSPW